MAMEDSNQRVRDAFANQVSYCLANDAPITARIVESIIAVINDDTRFGRNVLGWQGNPLADALPLRCAGGFHSLHLSGVEPALAGLYAGEASAMANAPLLIGAALCAHQDWLLPWLDGPPQTNEAGRSSNYIAAFGWLASHGLPPRLECLEIGSSAGLNLLLEHCHYDLAGAEHGPADAAIRFQPEWRGSPPPGDAFSFESLRGCDIAPVDLTDPAQALRLKAYIWPEHHVRFARMQAGIELVHRFPPDLEKADAADWLEAQLAKAQSGDTTRVLMHSIMWQYMPPESQQRIEALMAAAGAQATPDRPLAWVALEANRNNFRHELVVRYWRGESDDGEPTQLAEAHAHGAWIDWTG